MSPIGKIFAVINLILAAAFLGWASNALATSGKFKKQYEDESAAHTASKQQWEDERGKLTSQVQELESARARFRQEKDDAVNASDRFKSEVETERTTNSQLRSSVDKIQGDLGDLVATNKALETSKSQATQAQTEAERARDKAVSDQKAAEMALRESEQKLAAREKDIAELQAEKAKLTGELASLDAKFKTVVDRTGITVDKVFAQPLIEGRVLEVNKSVEPGLVALNVGKEAGVERGFVFEVYRGGEYVGQVRIENVRPTMSTGLILRTYEGREVRQGDMAATRL